MNRITNNCVKFLTTVLQYYNEWILTVILCIFLGLIYEYFIEYLSARKELFYSSMESFRHTGSGDTRSRIKFNYNKSHKIYNKNHPKV